MTNLRRSKRRSQHVLSQVIATPPTSAVTKGIAAVFDYIVAKDMAKDPDDR
jgi:hypothetical protein